MDIQRPGIIDIMTSPYAIQPSFPYPHLMRAALFSVRDFMRSFPRSKSSCGLHAKPRLDTRLLECLCFPRIDLALFRFL
jgi:hypothetical protein